MSATETLGPGTANPRGLEDDASATVKVVQTYLPGFEPRLKLDLKYEWWSFELPCPLGADYLFTLAGELGGQRQTEARLARGLKSDSAKRFWYGALEMADFKDDSSKLEDIFHQQVKSLLRYPTRIMESKGVMWLSYRAQFQSEEGWQRLRGGVSYLGLGFGVPFIGSRRVFTSPPLANRAQP